MAYRTETELSIWERGGGDLRMRQYELITYGEIKAYFVYQNCGGLGHSSQRIDIPVRKQGKVIDK